MGAYGAIAGAALGALQNNQKTAEYNQQKQMAADVERNSPWTHQSGMSMMPGAKPTLLGSVMQGATTGATMGAAGNSLFGGGGGAGGAPGGAGGGMPAAASGGGSPWGGVSGQQAGMGGGPNPFELDQQFLKNGSGGGTPTLYGQR